MIVLNNFLKFNFLFNCNKKYIIWVSKKTKNNVPVWKVKVASDFWTLWPPVVSCFLFGFFFFTWKQLQHYKSEFYLILIMPSFQAQQLPHWHKYTDEGEMQLPQNRPGLPRLSGDNGWLKNATCSPWPWEDCLKSGQKRTDPKCRWVD